MKDWIKDWVEKQNQSDRLADWYKNHEMDNGIKPFKEIIK